MVQLAPVTRYHCCNIFHVFLLLNLLVFGVSALGPYTGNEGSQKPAADVIGVSGMVGGIPVCHTGWSSDGQTCVDIDECDISSNLCDTNANCTNTLGGYDCTCNTGWSGDGFVCKDIDECALNLDVCHIHAVCSNSIGGYTCTCEHGWTGDGFQCKVLEVINT